MSKSSDTRDQLRARIFSADNRKFRSEVVEFFGMEVEVRQPSLGQILNAQNMDDRREAIIKIIIDYCYVPGTNERVFEAADRDSLMALPFGEDILRVNEAITRMTQIDVAGERKNSESTQSDE